MRGVEFVALTELEKQTVGRNACSGNHPTVADINPLYEMTLYLMFP